MSFFKYYGWTKTILIDFQNERFLVYYMFFLLGSLCFKLGVFDSDSYDLLYNILVAIIILIPACPPAGAQAIQAGGFASLSAATATNPEPFYIDFGPSLC